MLNFQAIVFILWIAVLHVGKNWILHLYAYIAHLGALGVKYIRIIRNNHVKVLYLILIRKTDYMPTT